MRSIERLGVGTAVVVHISIRGYGNASCSHPIRETLVRAPQTLGASEAVETKTSSRFIAG